ncbi:MAG: hypothetical protein HC788_14330 [Sphingopyxis sp.]|nr:hypothetical protein [Sphingopyxis sp.]
MQLVDTALRGAVSMARRGDPVAVRALLAAARHQLGLIAERYAAHPFQSQRRELLIASRALQKLGGEAADPGQFAVSAYAWRARFANGLAQRLRQKERLSLYNPGNLLFVAPQQNNR